MDSSTPLTQYRTWLPFVLAIGHILVGMGMIWLLGSLDYWRIDRFPRPSRLRIGPWRVAVGGIPVIFSHRQARKHYQRTQSELQDIIQKMNNGKKELDTEANTILHEQEASLGQFIDEMENDKKAPAGIVQILLSSARQTLTIHRGLHTAHTFMSQALQKQIDRALTTIQEPIPSQADAEYYFDQATKMIIEAKATFSTFDAFIDVEKDVTAQRKTVSSEYLEELRRREKELKQAGGKWQEIQRLANLYQEQAHRFTDQEAFARKYGISPSTLERRLREYERFTGQKIRPGRGRKKG